MKKGLILGILCALVLSLATGCCKEEESLRMEVESIVASGDNQVLTLNIQNNTGNIISYGWAGSCKFEVTTDQGSYVCDAPFMGRILQGSSTEKVNLSKCPGKVESIVITELCQLSDSGLPENELHDLTLYSNHKGITAFEDSFGFFDDPNWYFGIMAMLVPAFIVLTILANVLGCLFLVRKFISVFSGHSGHPSPAFHDHSTQMMHDQARQMAHDAHMQDVNRQIQENIHQHTLEAIDFGTRSVTPIDQGGFIPPPAPPMFF